MGSNTSIVGRLRAGWVNTPRIAALGIVATASLLSACGQKGGLYLPTEAAARERATLPQSVLPASSASAARAAPASSPPASAAR
jgi:predicted small lipoprotein YifL